MPARKPDLLVVVDTTSDDPLYLQVYEQVKTHILSGSLTEGDKLPSIRKLTQVLNVSHVTVERAYLQLSVEGYVQNVPRSGYVVNGIDIGYFTQEAANSSAEVKRILDAAEPDPLVEELLAGKTARYNFSYCNLQPGSFPRRVWTQLSNEVMRTATNEELASYACQRGANRLQKTLAQYLQQSRGVTCEPEQIVFQSGTEATLRAIVDLFQGELSIIMNEEPGYEVMTAIAKHTYGARLAPMTVSDNEGILDSLEREKPQLIFTTPSHQFPTGRVMPMDERVRLLQWAAENNAYIIEDDSCNEYRYDTQSIPSLQSLDQNNRVIYVCNFSKALSPGLRIAYAVLPPELLERWMHIHTVSWDPVPYITRETLASFIEQGHWSQHLRRMATDNKRRHDALVECLQREFPEGILDVKGLDSGMHLYVKVNNGMSQQELLDSALEQGALVHGTRQYWFAHECPGNAVLIGFSAIPLKDVAEGVRALRRAWC